MITVFIHDAFVDLVVSLCDPITKYLIFVIISMYLTDSLSICSGVFSQCGDVCDISGVCCVRQGVSVDIGERGYKAGVDTGVEVGSAIRGKQRKERDGVQFREGIGFWECGWSTMGN